jgi:hypothetical protein
MPQMQYAREGKVTEEMVFAAAREGVDPELVRSEVRVRAAPTLDVDCLYGRDHGSYVETWEPYTRCKYQKYLGR